MFCFFVFLCLTRKCSISIFFHIYIIYYISTSLYILLQACSEEQKTFASEVIETLNTFNQVSVINSNSFLYSFKSQILQIVDKWFVLQEQLLAFRVSVGPTDALNVKQLFFEDFIELSRHLQVKQLYTKSHNEWKTTFNTM